MIFKRRTKNKAIKKYFTGMYPLLVKRYGATEAYTKGQILRTVEECGFNNNYRIYALALFLEKSEFMQLQLDFQDDDLEIIRHEVADIFFDGDLDYSFKTYKKSYIGNEGYLSENSFPTD